MSFLQTMRSNVSSFNFMHLLFTLRSSSSYLCFLARRPVYPIYPHPTSCISIQILSTHLRLGLPSGLFPSDFPTKTLYTPLSSPIPLDFITRTILGEHYKSFSLLSSLNLYQLLGLALPNDRFPSVFPSKCPQKNAFSPSYASHARPSHPLLSDHLNTT